MENAKKLVFWGGELSCPICNEYLSKFLTLGVYALEPFRAAIIETPYNCCCGAKGILKKHLSKIECDYFDVFENDDGIFIHGNGAKDGFFYIENELNILIDKVSERIKKGQSIFIDVNGYFSFYMALKLSKTGKEYSIKVMADGEYRLIDPNLLID